MSTRTVSRAAQNANALADALDANAPALAASLAQRFAAKNVPLHFDPAEVFADLAAFLRASAIDAVATDETYRGEVTTHRHPADVRDQAIGELRHGLRVYRASLVGYYGPVVAAAFPHGGAPKADHLLASYASQVVKNVGALGASWAPLPSTMVTLDLAQATKQLAALAAAAQKASDAAVLHAKGAKGDKTARDAAFDVLHEAEVGIAAAASGLLEAAGETGRAEQITTHHHGGHVAQSPAPAPTPPAPPAP